MANEPNGRGQSLFTRILYAPYTPLALVLVFAFAAYAPTLGYWFYADDFWFLRASQSTPTAEYVQQAFDYREAGPVPEFLYRPFYVVTFRVLFTVFGLHAWAYHLFGLILHLVNVVLLWGIARKVTGRLAVANVAAFVFALHPTYAVAVVLITNNVVVIATFVYLSCLLAFLKYLDGGSRSWLWYAGSFVAFVSALLLHPETSHLLPILVFSYLFLSTDSFREFRRPRSWASFIPFVIIMAAFLLVQLQARSANDFQSESFQVGWHLAENYLRYAALALDPLRAAPGHPFLPDVTGFGWRAALPVTAFVAAAAYIIATERTRPCVGLFALAWLLVAILPLASWVSGAYARKLYSAGPPLALMLSVVGVSVWDRALVAIEEQSRRKPDERGKSPSWSEWILPAATVIVACAIAIALGLRAGRIAEPVDEDASQFEYMISQLRREHPAVQDGAGLYLVGVPWPFILLGDDSAGFASAVALYYGDVPFEAVVNSDQLEDLPQPPSQGDVVLEYECPPICQPPFASQDPE